MCDSAKPMLKKVAKTESRLAKFDKEKLKKSGAFRDQLKSTGKFIHVHTISVYCLVLDTRTVIQQTSVTNFKNNLFLKFCINFICKQCTFYVRVGALTLYTIVVLNT